MENSKLLSKAQMGPFALANHIAMAPMTRSRATATHTPTPIMAEYYGQRASVGLVISEGTSPSADGLGYPRIPGIYSQEQIEGWKPVTDAVRAQGAIFFLQIMHTGRVSHPLNMPDGAEVIAPSAIGITGEQMWTDQQQLQDYPTPRALETSEIAGIIQEYVTAAQNAIAAGFDGVELHGANGYLIEQFLRPSTNHRTDQYGGSTENYTRFALEVTQAVANAIGAEKVGIRLSPGGVFNQVVWDDSCDAIYEHLVAELSPLGLAYVHFLNQAALGGIGHQSPLLQKLRALYSGTIILNGGYTPATAEAELEAGLANLISFGRPLMANPDFAARASKGAPLAEPDMATAYTPGTEGYTDYATLAEVAA
jgi:N-ethylmaleimide reductase